MTEEDRRMLETHATYVGPVVQASRQLLEKMQPLPLCAVCPSAQWYRIEVAQGEAHLEAFCAEFRGVMYDRRKPTVTACDARTDAIKRQ